MKNKSLYNPRQSYKLENKKNIFAIYFCPLVARVSEGHISEHPVNTGSLERV
jgi:hypothetical protein